jgi:tRNA dimethylallyltransferase
LLAERLGAEVLSFDSMSVYRGMDVGTAKPSPEQRARVAHHLVDVADPAEPFSIARFQALARRALAEVAGRGRRALLVGGSGLYFRAVVDDLDVPPTDPGTRAALASEGAAAGPARLHARLRSVDPEAAARIEPGNLRRTVRALEVATITGRPFSSFAADWGRYPGDRVRAAGVRLRPEVLGRHIEDRVRRQVEEGLVDEVRALLDRGFEGFLTAGQAIGYAEMVEHVTGRITLQEAMARTVRRTRALARRQLAWFRRDPRVRWFEAGVEGAPGHVDEIGEHLAHG